MAYFAIAKAQLHDGLFSNQCMVLAFNAQFLQIIKSSPIVSHKNTTYSQTQNALGELSNVSVSAQISALAYYTYHCVVVLWVHRGRHICGLKIIALDKLVTANNFNLFRELGGGMCYKMNTV
jgi:hypothetical protein